MKYLIFLPVRFSECVLGRFKAFHERRYDDIWGEQGKTLEHRASLVLVVVVEHLN